MSRDWETTFAAWSKGPSKTEQDRAANAERQITQAIAASDKLKSRSIDVFTQGSYRNRVNVKQDSDIDVGVLCFDTYFPEYPDDNVKTILEKSSHDASYLFSTFKNELGESLISRFGRDSVTRGSKSFDIKANSYRVEADVAAFFEHRRYTSSSRYLSGVEMIPDDHKPARIKNWPTQHYENGVQKNSATDRRYKRIVRIVKKLCNEMSDNGITAAMIVPSFLVECLVWNVPNSDLLLGSYRQIVRSAIAHIYNNTLSVDQCSEWGEVSELKYLFRTSQPWTRQQANDFADSAWNYIGYK